MAVRGEGEWVVAGIPGGWQMGQLDGLGMFSVERELLGQEGLHLLFCI